MFGNYEPSQHCKKIKKTKHTPIRRSKIFEWTIVSMFSQLKFALLCNSDFLFRLPSWQVHPTEIGISSHIYFYYGSQ